MPLQDANPTPSFGGFGLTHCRFKSHVPILGGAGADHVNITWTFRMVIRSLSGGCRHVGVKGSTMFSEHSMVGQSRGVVRGDVAR